MSGYKEGRDNGIRKNVEYKKDEEWDAKEKSLKGVINYIFGGFARGGSPVSARKTYVRAIQSLNVVSTHPMRHMPPITFWDEDFQVIDPQHDDPMVILVEIEDFVVRKTLVDQGSLLDILY